jgi:hypothetical protein
MSDAHPTAPISSVKPVKPAKPHPGATAEPEELHNAAGHIRWVSGRSGEAPAYAGTDFFLARDGRIVALDLFCDPRRLSCQLLDNPEA